MLTVKQKFSHLGFAITLYMVIANLLSLIAAAIIEVGYVISYMVNYMAVVGYDTVPTDPAFYSQMLEGMTSGSSLLIFASSLPGYFIAVPLTLWFLNATKYRDVPLKGLSFSTPYEKTLKRNLSVAEFITFFLIAVFFGAAGSLVSAALSAIYSTLTGKDMNNLLNTMLSDMPIGTVLILTVILAPIFEEILYRYGVVGYCRRYGEWNAIIVSAVIFGLVHTNLFQFFYAFLLGGLFAYVYIQTRQIKYTIAMHMLFNFLGAGVPLMLSPDGAMNTAVIIYYLCFYSLAVIGLVLLIIYIKSEKLKKPTGNSPIPGYCCKDTFINTGMIVLFVLCLILTVYMQFFAPNSMM